MMEAARILQTIGAKPRRTIRVALWSGEEEGLLGSFDYVKRHFGSAEAPTPDYNKLDAYWNIDDGTGRVRGGNIFGPPEAAKIIAQYFKPFEDLGIFGANASTARVEGGSDNGAFAVAGLPGIGAQQDPIEYNSTTWHTNLDNYERIVPQDVIGNAVISASLVYHIANRDEMLPRFAPDKMPAVPARGGGGGGAGGRGGAADAGPTATPHVYAITKNTPLTVAGPALTAMGGRGGGGTMVATASLGTSPAHGKLLLTATGGFVYTPATGFTGTDSFTFKVARDGATSPEATVTIVVR
jgi:hypothetical protein